MHDQSGSIGDVVYIFVSNQWGGTDELSRESG